MNTHYHDLPTSKLEEIMEKEQSNIDCALSYEEDDSLTDAVIARSGAIISTIEMILEERSK